MSIFLPIVSGNSGNLARFLEIMRTHPDQRRPQVVWDDALASVAQKRAEDMSKRNYFGHVDLDGYGPNYHVRQADIRLPDWYQDEPHSNNVEIIAGGYSTPEDCFAGFLTSPGHKMFLLGEHVMFEQQTLVGIGWDYRWSSKYRPIWAILCRPP